MIFFSPHLAEQVIEQATETVEKENYERELIRQRKYRFRDVYPLNLELQKKYEEEVKKSGERKEP